MLRSLLLTIWILFSGMASLFAQPLTEWQKTLGGTADDQLSKVLLTSDGGYLLGGYSTTGIEREKTKAGRGNYDFWLIKLSADSTVLWDKAFGGTGRDVLMDMQRTMDGGFILGGYSDSGIENEKSEASRGDIDYWIIKLDADGTKEWDKTIGGTSHDTLRTIRQTGDGGYILAGTSNSPAGGDKSDGLIGSDAEKGTNTWLVKVSSTGTKLWDKTLGSGPYEQLSCLALTSDEGFIIGIDQSGFEKISGEFDVLKVSSTGEVQWEKKYGRQGLHVIRVIQQTSDGGYIMGGMSTEFVNQNGYVEADGEILKVDSKGNVIWGWTLSALDNFTHEYDAITDLVQTSDGGYLFCGSVGGSGGPFRSGSKGGQDYWVAKLAYTGNYMWTKTIGGIADDYLQSIVQTPDGGFLLGGYSRSPKGRQKTESSEDPQLEYDYWVVKLAEESILPVTLTHFNVQKENSGALISWQTTSETRSDRFEVEHSQNGKAWNRIAVLNAKGESEAVLSYQFTHLNPVNGDNYYRLKMVDTDGSFTHSKIAQINFYLDFNVSIYPNPAVGTIHLKVTDWAKVKGVQMLTSQGKILYSSGSMPQKEISTKAFKLGLYFIKMTFNDGTETTRKIVAGQ